MARTIEVDARPVPMLFCAEDEDLARALTQALRDRGVAVTAPPGQSSAPAEAAVVLISDAACRDPSWRAQVVQFGDRRLVPVAVRGVTASQVPAPLAALNWILLDADSSEVAPQVFAALQSDLGSFRAARGLEVQAASWVASGREKDALISSWPQVNEAARQLERALAAGLLVTSSDLDGFVRASLAHARRTRRRRNLRWLFRTGFVALGVAVVVGVVMSVREIGAGNRLQYSVLDVSEDRPDLRAIKLSGLIANGQRNEGVAPVAARRLALTLALPWTSGTLGSDHDSSLNSIVFLSEDEAVTADGRGTVSWWNLGTAAVTHRRAVVEEPLYELGVSPSGRLVAAATAASVHVLEGRTGQVSKGIPVPSPPEHVRVTDDGVVVVVTQDGRLLTIAKGAFQAKQQGQYERVLGLTLPSRSSVLALVRSGSKLMLVDATSGRELESVERPSSEFESGAVAEDGSVVIHGGDGQLWWGKTLPTLVRTGVRVPDVLDDVAALPGGVVAFAADADGTRLVHAPSGLDIGRICPSLSSLFELVPEAAGDRIACLSRGLLQWESTAHRAPVNEGAPSSSSTLAVRGAAGPVQQVSTRPDGLLEVHVRATTDEAERTHVFDPVGRLLSTDVDISGPVTWAPETLHQDGPTTTVALNSSGETFAVGSSDGTVTEVDVRGPGYYSVVARWKLPDRAAVTSLKWVPGADGELVLHAYTEVRRWDLRSCAGCYGDLGLLLERVRDRVWPCYLQATLDTVDEVTRDLLELRRCAQAPEASR